MPKNHVLFNVQVEQFCPIENIPPALQWCICFLQLAKHFFLPLSGIAFRRHTDSAFTASTLLKWVPSVEFFSLSNRKKSQGAKPGEYGGCESSHLIFCQKWAHYVRLMRWCGVMLKNP